MPENPKQPAPQVADLPPQETSTNTALPRDLPQSAIERLVSEGTITGIAAFKAQQVALQKKLVGLG